MYAHPSTYLHPQRDRYKQMFLNTEYEIINFHLIIDQPTICFYINKKIDFINIPRIFDWRERLLPYSGHQTRHNRWVLFRYKKIFIGNHAKCTFFSGDARAHNPIGLAAYILEKFSTWTNPEYRSRDDGGLDNDFSKDALLDNLMIYFLTNSITTSVRLYSEAFILAQQELKIDRVAVSGCTYRMCSIQARPNTRTRLAR